MHMAFRSWFDVMRAFHLVEERRARRELGKVAKKLLRKVRCVTERTNARSEYEIIKRDGTLTYILN